MPSVSKSQQKLFGIARAIQKGEKEPNKAGPEAKRIAREVSAKDVKKFAGTSHKGLPRRKALVGPNNQGMTNSVGYPTPKACMKMEDAARLIINQVLSEDGEALDSPEEGQEVSIAKTILSALDRLQGSLSNVSETQQRDLTTIRASASTLIRMHQQPESNPEQDYARALANRLPGDEG
jgi:hypothetical protein